MCAKRKSIKNQNHSEVQRTEKKRNPKENWRTWLLIDRLRLYDDLRLLIDNRRRIHNRWCDDYTRSERNSDDRPYKRSVMEPSVKSSMPKSSVPKSSVSESSVSTVSVRHFVFAFL